MEYKVSSYQRGYTKCTGCTAGNLYRALDSIIVLNGLDQTMGWDKPDSEAAMMHGYLIRDSTQRFKLLIGKYFII